MEEYERQINELTDYYRKMDWSVEKIFANKISGVIRSEEREEITELIDYVKPNNINRVVCLEISRVGRNVLEALKVIQILNENKVGLYVKNYNLATLDADGNVNSIAALLHKQCDTALPKAQMCRPETVFQDDTSFYFAISSAIFLLHIS